MVAKLEHCGYCERHCSTTNSEEITINFQWGVLKQRKALDRVFGDYFHFPGGDDRNEFAYSVWQLRSVLSCGQIDWKILMLPDADIARFKSQSKIRASCISNYPPGKNFSP